MLLHSSYYWAYAFIEVHIWFTLYSIITWSLIIIFFLHTDTTYLRSDCKTVQTMQTFLALLKEKERKFDVFEIFWDLGTKGNSRNTVSKTLKWLLKGWLQCTLVWEIEGKELRVLDFMDLVPCTVIWFSVALKCFKIILKELTSARTSEEIKGDMRDEEMS